MEEKRKFQRFLVELDAEYTLEAGGKGDCKITDISREGTRIELFSKEDLQIGTSIQLRINAPGKEEPVECSAILMWSMPLEEGTGYNFIVGGLFSSITQQDRHLLLDYAYDSWKKE